MGFHVQGDKIVDFYFKLYIKSVQTILTWKMSIWKSM